ncbi:hypothetical protein D3C84_720620 [compost metagenome]
MKTFAPAPGNEIHQENHVRHPAGSVEGVLDVQRFECSVACRARVVRRFGGRRGFFRPAPPGKGCEQQGYQAKAQPCFAQALLKQERHQRSGKGNANAHAHEYDPGDQTAPGRRHMSQNGRSGQHHQRATGGAGQESPHEEPRERHGVGTREKRHTGQQHHCSEHEHR